jgi:hypothetical protein
MSIEEEFDLLREYMAVIVQLLPSCYEIGGSRMSKRQLPSFQYFKDTYYDISYSLALPHYRDGIYINKENTLVIDQCKGSGDGVYFGIAIRPFNYWQGVKYFTQKNINGEYFLLEWKLRSMLKGIK